jgi:hypothetical protein
MYWRPFGFHIGLVDGCSLSHLGLPDRRGTKAGHQYQPLGHSISGEIVVEPYLITLTEEAKPYTLFQQAGVEFIYMLTGTRALSPRRQGLSARARRRPPCTVPRS